MGKMLQGVIQPISVDVQSREEFSVESRQAFTRLQDAVRGVLAVSAVNGQRPTDLAKTLDLDYALAWQIHTLASQSDMEVSARVVPKAGAMERFLKAAETFVPSATAASARDAYSAFETTVEQLAGDRDTFDAIVTLQRPQDASGLRRIRRAAYKANTAVWGVMCRCGVSAFVLHETKTGEQHAISIRGRVGFQRLYPGAMTSIAASSRFYNTTALAEGEQRKTKIAPCELIEEACTKPLPTINRFMGKDGTDSEQLTIAGISKLAESTFFWRNIGRDLPSDMSKPPHRLGTTCVVPTEHMILDFLIPSKWLKKPVARVWTTPDSTRLPTPDPEGAFHLPFEGAVKHLGRSIGSLHTPTAPMYAEVVRSQLAELGWLDEMYEIFRCEVQYPILHTTTQVTITDDASE
jgi:hypothetical protein